MHSGTSRKFDGESLGRIARRKSDSDRKELTERLGVTIGQTIG